MINITDLSTKKLNEFLENLSDYEVSEKLDGSQLLIGRDEKGYYTSRETKGGKRIYSVDDYGYSFRDEYMRAAHSVVEYISPYANLSIGDQIEVEVLYGSRPNVVPYFCKTNTIVLLRRTAGTIDLNDLYTRLSFTTITITIRPSIPVLNRLDIIIADRLTHWTVGIVNSVPLTDSVINQLSNVTADDNKVSRVNEILLTEYVRGATSKFGTVFGWIEGVVLRNIKTGNQIKVVDRAHFTKIKNFCWKERDSVTKKTYHVDDTFSLYGKFLVDLGNTINLPELGTLQAKKSLHKISANRQDVIAHFVGKYNFESLQDKWDNICITAIFDLLKQYDHYLLVGKHATLVTQMGNRQHTTSYDYDIHRRTKKVYVQCFNDMGILHNKICNSTTCEELINILIDKYYE